MLLGKKQSLFFMLEDTGLIHVALTATDLCMAHTQCIANTSSFHSNGEENYRFKKSSLISKEADVKT